MLQSLKALHISSAARLTNQTPSAALIWIVLLLVYLFAHYGGIQIRISQNETYHAGRYMAELETSAWLNDRRFRFLCFQGRSFAFSDLYYHTYSNPRRDHTARFKESAIGSPEFGVTAEAASQKVLFADDFLTSKTMHEYLCVP